MCGIVVMKSSCKAGLLLLEGLRQMEYVDTTPPEPRRRMVSGSRPSCFCGGALATPVEPPISKRNSAMHIPTSMASAGCRCWRTRSSRASARSEKSCRPTGGVSPRTNTKAIPHFESRAGSAGGTWRRVLGCIAAVGDHEPARELLGLVGERCGGYRRRH
jgi:hypothetical protein